MKRSVFCITFLLFLFSASRAWAIQTSDLTDLGPSKKIHAQLIMPDGNGPFPAVLVLHTSSGVKKEDIAYAQALAKEGYACLIPYYFDAYSISYDTRNWATSVYAERILEDFSSEIDYLKSLPTINKNKVGAVGFSMGGYWAMLLAGMEKIQAGVSYYGDFLTDPEARYYLDDIFNKHSSPVLILHGEDDMTVDMEHVKKFTDMLKGKFCSYELHTYPNARHRFDRGSSLHAPAAQDSWKQTLTFLKKYLRATASVRHEDR